MNSMPAKKENKMEYAQLSLKIDKTLNTDVEKFWRENLYQDKSTLVREALEYYIHTIECQSCGTRVHPASIMCPVCGSGLPTIERLKKAYNELYVLSFAFVDEKDRLETKYNKIYQEYRLSVDEVDELFDPDYQSIGENLKIFWKKLQMDDFFNEVDGEFKKCKEVTHRAHAILTHPKESYGDLGPLIQLVELQAYIVKESREKINILDASLDLILDLIKKYQSKKKISERTQTSES